jgi:hypothetical protein
MTAIRFNKEQSEGKNMSTAIPVIVQGTIDDPPPRAAEFATGCRCAASHPESIRNAVCTSHVGED